MSLGRAAIPSARIFAPSLIIGYIMRSRISSSLTTRFLRPRRASVSSISFSTSRLRSPRAHALSILLVALAGLLAETAGFAQRVRDLRLDAAVLARAPADIETG